MILEAFRRSLNEAQSEEEYKKSVENVLELTKNFHEMTKLMEKIGKKQVDLEQQPTTHFWQYQSMQQSHSKTFQWSHSKDIQKQNEIGVALNGPAVSS